MKLYAFYPEGHGPQSYFVMAESEEEARAAISVKVRKAIDLLSWEKRDSAERKALSEEEEDFLKCIKYGAREWPESYEMEVYEQGEIALNDND